MSDGKGMEPESPVSSLGCFFIFTLTIERILMLVPNPQFFDKTERLNKTCPKCGSDKVSYLLHSIFYEDGDEQLVKSGEIIQMGCMYHEPFNLGCRDCQHTWASVPMSMEK